MYERFGIPPEEMDEVAGEREAQAVAALTIEEAIHTLTWM